MDDVHVLHVTFERRSAHGRHDTSQGFMSNIKPSRVFDRQWIGLVSAKCDAKGFSRFC